MILSMKRMVVLSTFFVILGVAAIWGLEAGTLKEAPKTPETEGAGIMVEASHFPLKLTMILNKTTFEVEEPVNFTLVLENIGNETLTIHSGGDHFSFIVYDKNGSKVYEPDPVWLAVYVPPEHLPPGLALRAQGPWLAWYQQYTPIFRGWGEEPLFEYRKAPPGAYQIVGQFISHTLNFTIETPTVIITIT